MSNVKISDFVMTGSNFEGAVLDNISFNRCYLRNSNFSGSLIFECELNDVDLEQADFRNIDVDSNFVIKSAEKVLMLLSGYSAIGYLRFKGALTDDVDPYYVWQHHPKFPIVFKICENIQDQKNSQLRGLTQRGASQSDPVFARSFVSQIEKLGFVDIDRHELVSATPLGRKHLPLFVDRKTLPVEFADFLKEWL